MQNVVPADPDTGSRSPTAPSLAAEIAARSLANRSEAYAEEVRRLIEATYAVMRRTGGVDPRVSDIVRESGLSNQAFYRHFAGKDALMLAVLDDGRRQLVTYLEHRLADADPGPEQVRRWVDGMMEQARNPVAAENTRPFAIDSARLTDRFPDETERSRGAVVATLRPAVAACGGDPSADADAIYHLVMGVMNDALMRRVVPSRADVSHLTDFVLRGLGADR